MGIIAEDRAVDGKRHVRSGRGLEELVGDDVVYVDRAAREGDDDLGWAILRGRVMPGLVVDLEEIEDAWGPM